SGPPGVCFQLSCQCWLLPCSHTRNRCEQHTNLLLTFYSPCPYLMIRFSSCSTPLSITAMITPKTAVIHTTATVCLTSVGLSGQVSFLHSSSSACIHLLAFEDFCFLPAFVYLTLLNLFTSFLCAMY